MNECIAMVFRRIIDLLIHAHQAVDMKCISVNMLLKIMRSIWLFVAQSAFAGIIVESFRASIIIMFEASNCYRPAFQGLYDVR